MFDLQQKIYDSLPKLTILFNRYANIVSPESIGDLQTLNTELPSFKMRVPLIGAFSAGKSSLLNAMLAQKLLSVEIDPASSLATELHFDPTEQIIGHAFDGKVIRLTPVDLQDQKFDGLVPDGWVEVRLNSAVLERFPHLCLADLPGLDSGLSAHARAIDSYIGRSLSYCLVVSSDEGTLHESIINFLKELKLYQVPVLVVISKSDKKTETELDHLVTHLTSQIRKILGENAKVDVMTSSARKKNIEPFLLALDRLESQSEQRFRETVGVQALKLLIELDQMLTVLSNQDDLNHEEIVVKRQQLEQEMQHYNENLIRETTSVESQLDGVLDKINTLVESRLKAQLEQFASLVAQQSDVNSTIQQTVRLATTEGIQQDFAPIVQRYISRVEDELPNALQVSNQFTFQEGEDTDHSFWIDSAAAALTIALRTNPIAAVLIPVITKIIELFMSQQSKEAKREEQHEQARDYVLSHLIPQIMQQVRVSLRRHLDAQIQQVKQKLDEQAQQESKSHQASLQQLDEQMQHGAASFAKVQDGYLSDLNQVQQLANTWKVL